MDRKGTVAAGSLAVGVILALVVAARWSYDSFFPQSPEPARTEACCESPVEIVDEAGLRVGCADDPSLARCGELDPGDQVRLLPDGRCERRAGGMGASLRLLEGLPVELNRASFIDLQLIDGIGPSLASAIVEFRQQNGRFERYEDLAKVSGIGPAKLEAFRQFLTVAYPDEIEAPSEDR